MQRYPGVQERSPWRRMATAVVATLLATAASVLAAPSASAAPVNDDFANAIVLSGTTATSGPDSTVGATKETGEPDHADDAGGASIWYRWTAPGDGAVIISTAGSTFDTTLGVYTGTAVNALTEVAANDDDPVSGDATSRVTHEVSSGTAYRIAVDGFGGATGNAYLSITYSAPPANDDFADALVISGASVGRGSDSNLAATKETGEPDHAGNPGGSSVWYRWAAPGAGTVTISTYGSDFDTLLAVYTGSSVSGLTPVASNDDDPVYGCCSSSVTFATSPSTVYRIAVDGLGGAQGTIVFALDYTGTVLPPANDNFADATVVSGTDILQGPDTTLAATKETGEPDHAGNTGGASIWYAWTAPGDGAVAVDTAGSNFNTLLGIYTGTSVDALTPVAANDDDPVNGGGASALEFTATGGATYAIAIDGKDGATGSAVLNLHLSAPATAAITWDPSGPRARVDNRPRTCNTPGPGCSDSGKSFTDGRTSVGVSTDGSRHYLHTIWTSNAPTGDEGNGNVNNTTQCATLDDPATGLPPYCAGVFYAQSTDGGDTWNGGATDLAPVRISDPSTHASRGAMAVVDEYVYVAWVETVGRAGKMCANDPRVLWVRVNTNHGLDRFWSPPIRLSSLTGRVDFPAITANGSSVHVVATDSDTGYVTLWSSHDWGETYSSQSIGHTRATYDNGTSPGSPTCSGAPTPTGLEGLAARPTIAHGGDVVAAAWFRNDNGKTVAKISTDDGATWPGGAGGWPCDGSATPCTMHMTPSGGKGAGDRSVVASAGAAGRVVFAWVDAAGEAGPPGVWTRTYLTTGGWQPKRLVSCLSEQAACFDAPAALRFNGGYAPAVTTYGTSGLGVAWTACPFTPTMPATPCSRGGQDPGGEILWKESWDNGITWSAGEGYGTSYRKLAGNGADPESVVNDGSAVAMGLLSGVPAVCPQRTTSSPVGLPIAGCERYVLFTGQSLDGSTSRLYLKIGTNP